MGKFVLIHGGSHGAWCWEEVSNELARLGHESFAWDLPGHGRDKTPRIGVNRKSYISAVLSFLEANDLSDVTIVAHSLAGSILPEVWQSAHHRISSMIFLAALVLRAGEAPIDLIPQDRRPSYYELAARSPDNSFLLPFEKVRVAFFNDLSEVDAQKTYSKLTPQPWLVYLDRAEKNPEFPKNLVRYVLCSNDKALPREICQSCAAILGVTPEEIASDHDVMLSHPRELTQLIVEGRYNNPMEPNV